MDAKFELDDECQSLLQLQATSKPELSSPESDMDLRFDIDVKSKLDYPRSAGKVA